jgi:thiamine biosynthesis lipoprotein
VSPRPDKSGLVKCQFSAFDTIVTVQAVADSDHGSAVLEDATALCLVYEQLFSRTLPDSEITRLNTAQGAWVSVSPDTFYLLEAAQYYCAESGGLFDVTIGAVSRLWDFKQGIIPAANKLAEAVAHVNWRCLNLRHDKPEQYLARLSDSEAVVDVGGIAKGYIADNLAGFFFARGIRSFLINLGGNVAAYGTKPNGLPWRVGIRNPQGTDSLKVIDAYNCSLVTSGIYERGFSQEGTFYHHVLEPVRGLPVKTDAVAVTVVADRSLDAEGFSTTLLALGVKNGLRFAHQHPKIKQVYFIDIDNTIHTIR